MTVAELKKMLADYPDDMEVIHTCHSDYEIIDKDDWSVIKGVPNPGGWIMRSHPTMEDYHKEREREYLHLIGN